VDEGLVSHSVILIRIRRAGIAEAGWREQDYPDPLTDRL